MQTYEFTTVDAFTTHRFGGNPLAVFPHAAGLSDAEMRSLAAQMNLSETTFVLPAIHAENNANVRIFNRTSEMPFAGHPNIGTAYVLASLNQLDEDMLRFEEGAGLVEVRVDRDTAGAVIAAIDPVTMAITTVASGPATPGYTGIATGLVAGTTLWLGSFVADKLAYRTLR